MLIALLYRDSQRAEYYADLVATRVSGAGAMVSTLRKLFFAESVEWIVHRYANFRMEGEDLFDSIRSCVQRIPAREIERLRRLGLREDVRVDASHPPTAHRITVIEQRGQRDPQLVASAADDSRVQAELEQFESAISHALAERYDETLWR